MLAVDDGAARATGAPVQWETDRARFIGRGRTLARPAACDPSTQLSGTVGPVLDPIFSIRCPLVIPPGNTVRVAFCTGVAKSREEALALAEQYHDPRAVQRAFELAWAHAQLELRHVHLSPGKIHLFQRLASLLLYPDFARRDQAAMLANRLGQAGLWRFGISGDYPIVLVRVSEADQDGSVRELLLAHENWRGKGLIVELVILNEHPTSYVDSVQDQMQRLLSESSAWELLNKRGGVFVLQSARLSEAERNLLLAAAQVVLAGPAGSLEKQLDLPMASAPLPALLAPRRSEQGVPSSQGLAATAPDAQAQFANGFGQFDPAGKEYVIRLQSDQRTPAPWSNVIANARFGTIVTESGCGCTWAENSQENRLTTWSNDPVSDPPAEAIYVRDEETGAFTGPTPRPVRDAAPYVIRHGQGYTQFEHNALGIQQRLLVSVAAEDPVKIYRLTLRNDSSAPRQLSATLCIQWVLGTHREQTQLHVLTALDRCTGALLATNAYHPSLPDQIAFLRVVSRAATSTGDRREFFGRNGSWERPAALGRVSLSGRTGPGCDPCGAVQTKLRLNPGEETEVVFVMGQARNREELDALLDRYAEPQAAAAAIEHTQQAWERTLTAIQVKTPNPALDLLVNRWLLYQTLSCRFWGRAAFYQSGGAYGFRDQLQDAMALVYSRPELAREHILRAAARQFEEGDVQHWWHPPAGQGVRTHFSDDFLWLAFVTAHYVEVTGDAAILDAQATYLHSPPLKPEEHERYELPEVSTQSDTLYAHCLRAIDHGLRFGPHGLPLMGTGDWNDGMNEVGAGGKGESVWVGWFLIAILKRFAPLAEQRGDQSRVTEMNHWASQLWQAIETTAWDGAWYRRAYFDDGTPLGSAQDDACQIDSLAQSWAVIAGGDSVRSRAAMQAVAERLLRADDRLVLLLWPPFDHTALEPGYIKGYLPGVRENGGQYTHAALWTVLAWAMLGEGDRAMQWFDLLNPLHHARSPAEAEEYRVEPYVVAADVYSLPPHVGRGGWTWYTGSASWMYRVALEHLLGWQVRGEQLHLSPCIPREWAGFEITYRRNDTTYQIEVANPAHVQRGIQAVTLDGEPLPSQQIPLADDRRTHHVIVTLGHSPA